MKKETYDFSFDVYDSINDLKETDSWLLRAAQEAAEFAYAPYSNFHVGAVAKLINGKMIAGANQENASYPAGLCAERVLLASAASQYPSARIDSIAISYRSETARSNHPIAPCGLCRQSLMEYEYRVMHPIRLILGGMEGKIYVIPNVLVLLPFSFTNADLK